MAPKNRLVERQPLALDAPMQRLAGPVGCSVNLTEMSNGERRCWYGSTAPLSKADWDAYNRDLAARISAMSPTVAAGYPLQSHAVLGARRAGDA